MSSIQNMNEKKKSEVFWAECTFLTNKISIYEPHFTEMLQKVTNCIEKLVDGTYRDPQWQKSEDTEKKLLGSSKYLASNRPYAASFSAFRAPTKMGTTFMGYLH